MIAKEMISSLIEHKYLERTLNSQENAQPASASEPAAAGDDELLHPVSSD